MKRDEFSRENFLAARNENGSENQQRQNRRHSSRSADPTYQDAMERMTIHGVTDFYQTKSFTWRVIWIIVLVIASILLCVEIARTIINFMNSPISTTYSILPLNERKFPKLYLCPLNIIDSRKLKELEYQKNEAMIMLKTFFELGASLMSKKDHFLSKINANYDVFQYTAVRPRMRTMTRLDVVDLMAKVSLNNSDFVRECSFQRQSMDCSNFTKKVFDGNRGQCYLIDVDKAQEVPGYGLNLVLDIRRDLYDGQLLPTFDGVLLTIMDDYTPGGVVSYTLLEPGGWAKISLQSRHYELLNTKSRVLFQPCIEEKTWRYDTLDYEFYSRESCRLDCAQNLSITYCKCVLPLEKTFVSPNVTKKYGFCDATLLKTCFYDTVIRNKTQELSNCVSKCLNPCNFWQHNIGSISRVSFSTVSVGSDKGNVENEPHCDAAPTENSSQRMCPHDVIILDIGYSDLIYTLVQQTPSMTFDTFVSNIGGQVGLWMGVSVISLVQLVTCFVLYCKDKLTHPESTVHIDD